MSLINGVNLNVSNADYHADRNYLSSSVLKTIYKSLDQYYKEYVLGQKEPIKNQDALIEGSLAHSMILEPHLVASEYNFYSGMRKAGADFESWKDNLANPNLPIVSAPQKHRVERLVEAYKQSKAATSLMKSIQVEHTVCTELNGVPVKARFDAVDIDRGIIMDVKTTGYAGDLDSFKTTCSQLMYPLSAALYCKVAEQVYGKPFKFYFIVLSKRDIDCHVYVTSDKTMNEGIRQVNEALVKYKKAKETNVWTEEVALASADSDDDDSDEILEV